MKTPKFFHALTVLTIIVISLFSFVSAQAKGSATVGTSLTIEPPVSVLVGNPANVVIHLVSSKGEPVANQRIEIFVDGERERAARTDESGNVAIRIRRDVAGTYTLSAVFQGSRLPSLGSSRSSAELVVRPELIEIHTTPSLPGLKFSLDGKVFTSDDYGVARIEVKEAGTYQLEVLPVENKDAHIQMNFGRWGDESFKPSREIIVPLNKHLEVGFEVHYRVSQTFIDLANQPIDPARVTSITYKGSNGATFTFEDTGTHWLPAGRIIRLNNGLEETRILYSVMSVVIDGANVVSQAQQRFYVDPDDLWTIQLLLYSARFTARDALFGFPIGSGIRMEYPDGDIQSYSFDPVEGYSIDGLARGIYRVTVTGAGGYAPATPIALSRDQDVELLVFSYIDLGVLLTIGLLLSVGLLLFGRPYLVTETAAFGRRIFSERRRLLPALRAQFSKWPALGSRMLPRKQSTKIEDDGHLAQIPAEEEAADPAISGERQADQDHVIEGTNGRKQKPTAESEQENEVKSPV